MNNKILTIFAVAPIYIGGLMGVFEISNETLEVILGFAMFIFMTWAGIRLYKTPDSK